jgi:hypothetical protein
MQNYLVLIALGGSIFLLISLMRMLSVQAQRRHEIGTRRLELIAEALRAPTLDAAARTELLRVLANQQEGIVGWIWRRLQNPTVWKVLWFGCGWLAMLLSGAALLIHAFSSSFGWSPINRYDLPGFVMATVAGFAMVTLPLALRELLRRERAAAQ